jgi:hypothetical protein
MGEVDLWFSLYGNNMTGIFFDEQSSSCSQAAYYSSLYSHVKTVGSSGSLVINNPGTIVPECLANSSDIIVTFEDAQSNYQFWIPAGWEVNYASSKFWHIVQLWSLASLATVVALLQQRHVGYLYMTDSTGYDGLPSYWQQLNSACAKVNIWRGQ